MFQFNQQEINELNDLLSQERFADAYTLVATTLFQRADLTDQSIEQVRLWFLGASQINAGVGTFNTLIRDYTFRQGQLHFGNAADTLFSTAQIQEASNEVARNAISDIIARNGVLKTIDQIADFDAIGVRDILFATDDDDTAFTNNAAWSGSVLLSMLQSDQTYRLFGDSRDNASFDSLDDLRNVLFAIDAFDYAVDYLVLEKARLLDAITSLNVFIINIKDRFK